MTAYEVTYKIGFGTGICHICDADYDVSYCHKHLINTCDGCLRAAYSEKMFGCDSCHPNQQAMCGIYEEYGGYGY